MELMLSRARPVTPLKKVETHRDSRLSPATVWKSMGFDEKQHVVPPPSSAGLLHEEGWLTPGPLH